MQRFEPATSTFQAFAARTRRGAAIALAGALALSVPGARADRPPITFDLVGTATRVADSLQLTPAAGGNGAAWRHTAISLTRSFKVKFRFSLRAASTPQADGLAFVIQTNGNAALGEGGGCLGVCGLNAVASVVQTYANDHVGLTLDAYPYDAPPSPIDLGYTQMVEGEQVVRYDAATHVLSMRGQLNVDGSVVDIADSRAVDLASLLGSDTATIGFSAGTGDNHADQRVWGFSFQYLD